MIKISDLSKIYNKGKSNEFQALKSVSLHIEKGDMVAIVGKSGAGKSTLLHIIGCMDKFEMGEYLLDGKSVAKISEKELASIRNEKVGIVMQDYALIESYSITENVKIPLYFSKKKDVKSQKNITDILKKVGLGDIPKKQVNKLSGGQKQRVAIARAIVNNPDIILADEPTGALDTNTSAEIISLFKQLNDEGKTVIIITHDPNVAEQCKRTITISDGKIIE